jgi:signal transduction histidine kinase
MGLSVPLLALLLASIGTTALAVAGGVALLRRTRRTGAATAGEPSAEPPAPRIGPPAPASEPCQEVSEEDIVPDPPAPSSTATDLALAVKAALGPLLADAARAASLLRMSLPTGTKTTEEHLARIEGDLREAEGLLAAVAAPVPPPALEPVHADRMLSDALAGVPFGPGVRVRRIGAPALAVADAGQLRQALRHVLRAASAAMPAGGELGLRTACRAGEVVLEISDTGAAPTRGLDLTIAERIIAAQGGRVERESIRGRGSVFRIALPAGAKRAG